MSSPNKTVSLPDWDGSPIGASLHLRNIGEYAEQQGLGTLLLKGYFVSRNMIICCSGDAVLACKLYHSDPIAHPLPSDIQNPPNPPAEATRESAYIPTTEDRRTYTASPEIFMHASSMLCQTLLSSITNRDVARRVRSESNNDARQVLISLANIRGELTAAHISHQLAKITQFARAGVHELAPSAFSEWKSTYQDMVFTLPLTHRLPDTYVAQDYRRAIQPLGDKFCHLVATEVKIKDAEDSPTLTAGAITLVLEERHLALQEQPQGNGHAFNAIGGSQREPPRAHPANSRTARRDPRKHARGRGSSFHGNQSNFVNNGWQNKPSSQGQPSYRPALTWNPNRRLCMNHGRDPRCDGRHLDRDCPAGKPGEGRSLTATQATAVPPDNASFADSIFDLLEDNSAEISTAQTEFSDSPKAFMAQRIAPTLESAHMLAQGSFQQGYWGLPLVICVSTSPSMVSSSLQWFAGSPAIPGVINICSSLSATVWDESDRQVCMHQEDQCWEAISGCRIHHRQGR